MKKFFLIIFLIQPAYAGPPLFLDPAETISNFYARLQMIRTKFASEYTKLSYQEKLLEFKKFTKLLDEFEGQKHYLRRNYPIDKLEIYKTFASELYRDKQRYEAQLNKELRGLSNRRASQ